MQDYRGCIPEDCSKTIRDIAALALIRRWDVETVRLGKVLRNSYRICQFLKANMGDKNASELQAIRNLPEDGIFFFFIQTTVDTAKLTLTPQPIYENEEHVQKKEPDCEDEIYEDMEEDFTDKGNKEAYDHKKANHVSHMANATDYEDIECHIPSVETADETGDHGDDDNHIYEDMDTLYSQGKCHSDLQNENDHVTHCDDDDNDDDDDDDDNDDDDDDHDLDVVDNDNYENYYLPKQTNMSRCFVSGYGFDKNSLTAERLVGKPTLLTRVQEVLAGNRYQEKDIAVLTEGSKDQTRVMDILRSANYDVQKTTVFPVQHIVVDTLANFEGLESPVILFIVPESWGKGYVGSLKYRLCIATRAISRLEFLAPWDPTGRQLDLLALRRAFGTEVRR